MIPTGGGVPVQIWKTGTSFHPGTAAPQHCHVSRTMDIDFSAGSSSCDTRFWITVAEVLLSLFSVFNITPSGDSFYLRWVDSHAAYGHSILGL